MKLTTKELIKLKTKLALEGSGSKGKLAELLEMHQSQITLLLDTGKCPERSYNKLVKYLNS